MISVSLRKCLYFAVFLRLLLIVYGLWQDVALLVKYTDIDYVVFTDAARFMSQGDSPYERATYRYTPLLAWLLQGNIYVSESFGKLLFAACDIVAGYIIYEYCMMKNGGDTRQAVICASVWLFNPLSVTVSTRGNAESVMAVLVLFTLLMVGRAGCTGTLLSALSYGLSVHMKIYPVTYAFALYLHINDRSIRKEPDNCADSDPSWVQCFKCCLPTSGSIMFTLVSVLAFLCATIICYNQYGEEFMHNAYWYHVTRSDIRHNFSLYFYMLYLMGTVPRAISLVLFVPQMILVVVVSFKYRRDLEFACFVQTFVFVTFNKVCTSQYFLWYICLLPVIIPRLTMSVTRAVLLIVMWLAGQGLWLLPAYLLEFHGYNTFFYIWLAGLLFFTVNVYILCQLLTSYSAAPEWLKRTKL